MGDMRSSSAHRTRFELFKGELHRRAKPLGFGVEGGATGAREAVVAPAPVIEVRVGSPRGFLDQPLVFEPPDGGVESAGSEAHGAVALLLDGFSDEVAVPVASRERQQNVV